MSSGDRASIGLDNTCSFGLNCNITRETGSEAAISSCYGCSLVKLQNLEDLSRILWLMILAELLCHVCTN